MNKQLYALILLIIGGSLLIAYSNSFSNQFVYDDVEFIVRNNFVKNLKLWPQYFTNITTQSEFVRFSHYRPLTTLSFALNYAFSGLNPTGYHLTNFIIHLLNVCLVFWLIRQLTEDDLLALLTGLFWGLHPLQTEAVSWIAGRGQILSATFYLAGILCYMKWRTSTCGWRWFLLTILAYSASLFCKELAITFPLILIFLDLMARQPEQKINRKLGAYLILIIIGGAFWFLRTQVVGEFAMRDIWSSEPVTILATMSQVMGRYFFLLLWPAGLHVDYNFPLSESLFVPEVIVMLGLLALMIYLIFFLFKRSPLISLAIGWFFIHILPVSNIVPFQVILAERFLYLPSLGFALILAYLIKTQKFWSGNLVYGLTTLICIVYAALTWQQNKVWANELTLFSQVVKIEPTNSKAHYGIGTWYLNHGDYDTAIAVLKVSVKLDKTNYLAYNNLGATYKFQQKFKEAIPNFNEAINLKSSFTEAYLNLSDSFASLGDFAKVTLTLEKLKAKNPDIPDVYYMLALAYLELGNQQLAKENCDIFISMLPGDPRGQFLRQMCR